MITIQHKQEQISKSFVIATAAAARVNLEITKEHDYGVDGTFMGVAARVQGIDGNGKEHFRLVESGIKVDFQLKCSKQWRFEGDNVVWSIPNKTFNDMVTRPNYAVSLFLVLMCLPEDLDQWVTTSEEHLVLRRCCYYVKLVGAPKQNEGSNSQIEIPRVNVLTPDAVIALLAQEEARMARQFQ